MKTARHDAAATTRLAYCTGIRRCAPSTYTMKATTAIISATRKIKAMA